MLASDSLTEVAAFAEARGLDLDHLQPTDAGMLMCDWYELQRADDVTLEQDGDMLLFQWGTYSWNGGAFSYDFTRQFILNETDDDAAIWQLSLTVLFDAADESESIGSGNRWCARPSELGDFRSFVASSVATSFAQARSSTGARLTFEQAG